MGSNALAIRFTDEKYSTKSDVVKALGTSLVDSIWRNIVGYRLQSAHKLSLKTIPQLPFYVTYTQPIASRINEFGVKLAHFMLSFGQIPPESRLLFEVERYAKLNILRDAAAIEGLRINDLSLKAMLNGTYFENNPAHTPILGYRDAINSFQSAGVNEDLLAGIYGLLNGQEELTSFYRVEDPDSGNLYRTIVINRDYQYAPHDEIPDLMEQLFNFLNNDTTEPIVHAIMALYYFDYVKPFSAHNDLVGCLLAKQILEEANIGLVARLLPLEKVMVPTERLKTLCLETQRSGDLTYVLLYALDILEPAIDDLVNEIKRAQAAIMQAERTPVTPSDLAKKPVVSSPDEDLDIVSPAEASAKTAAPEPMPEIIRPVPSPKPEPMPTPIAVKKPEPVLTPVPPKPAPVVAPEPVKPAVVAPVEPAYEAPKAEFLSEPEEAKPEAPVYSAPSGIYQEPAPKPAPVPSPKPAPVFTQKVEPAPTPKVEPAPAPKPAPAPIKPVVAPVKKVAPIQSKPLQEIPEEPAYNSVPTPVLSDHEMKEYARYIVETNPRVRKPQAVFFASHSALGRYYTIQDYKRTMRCAYETARTSMDNLAAEGFYQKLQIKNKFVYTPIKQGEKQ